MFRFTFLIFCALINNIQTNVSDNYIDENPIMNTYYMVANYHETGKTDRVTIHLFYETFCPYCRKFDTTVLRPIVQDLGPYLDLNLIPYGNAETTYNNGSYYFKCQHGPKECYGNKLHACAINLLNNMTSAVIFNSCLMDYSQPEHGSNDEAADNYPYTYPWVVLKEQQKEAVELVLSSSGEVLPPLGIYRQAVVLALVLCFGRWAGEILAHETYLSTKCGASLSIDPEQIKQCAKSIRGSELLKHYGDMTHKRNIDYVPYILLNGVLNDGDHFREDVCKAFREPPPPCRK